MKSFVYLVTTGESDYYRIHAIFLTRKEAEDYLKNDPEYTIDNYNEIEEWPLGDPNG